jgi:hypothetical protein
MYYMIERRKRTLHAREGSQRRCYNGCFPDSDWEEGWTNWDWINLKLSLEAAQIRLKFWEDLTKYAVSQRGKEAEQQYRIVPDTVYDGTW